MTRFTIVLKILTSLRNEIFFFETWYPLKLDFFHHFIEILEFDNKMLGFEFLLRYNMSF